jgi:hypothetical protein
MRVLIVNCRAVVRETIQSVRRIVSVRVHRQLAVGSRRLALFAAAFLALNLRADPFADRVESYDPGIGFAVSWNGTPYTNALAILGQPSRDTSAGPVTPFNAPFDPDAIVSLGIGGSITVSFASPILNDPSNPFGIDLLIYGSTMFIDLDYPHGRTDADASTFGSNPGRTRVWASAGDGVFYLLNPALAPVVDGLYPTDGAGAFGQPVDPSLGATAFANKTLAEIRALYAGSAGGSGYDLSWATDTEGKPVSLASASVFRVEVMDGRAEIDGLAAVPEPTPSFLIGCGVTVMLALGGRGFLSRRLGLFRWTQNFRKLRPSTRSFCNLRDTPNSDRRGSKSAEKTDQTWILHTFPCAARRSESIQSAVAQVRNRRSVPPRRTFCRLNIGDAAGCKPALRPGATGFRRQVCEISGLGLSLRSLSLCGSLPLIAVRAARTRSSDSESTPAPGVVGRSPAAHAERATSGTVWRVLGRSRSARGRAEPQPWRLRSPFHLSASLRLRELLPALLTALVAGPDVCTAAGWREGFESDPLQRGWRVVGDDSLFAWDEPGQQLRVTWNSSQSNSYFYRPLETVLAKTDDFSVRFDLRLDRVEAGINPDKPSTFEIALGLLNLASATNPTFLRGTGRGSPNLVEFDYFPAAGLIAATVSPVLVSSNNQFRAGFSFPRLLDLGARFSVTMRYAAGNQVLTTTVTRNGAPFEPTASVALDARFTDFRVDTFAISSYSDEGDLFGSVLAEGVVDAIEVSVPEPPLQQITVKRVNSYWEVQFASRTNWLYWLERTADLRDWASASPSVPGHGGVMTLRDTEGAAGQVAAFYRVKANRP